MRRVGAAGSVKHTTEDKTPFRDLEKFPWAAMAWPLFTIASLVKITPRLPQDHDFRSVSSTKSARCATSSVPGKSTTMGTDTPGFVDDGLGPIRPQGLRIKQIPLRIPEVDALPRRIRKKGCTNQNFTRDRSRLPSKPNTHQESQQDRRWRRTRRRLERPLLTIMMPSVDVVPGENDLFVAVGAIEVNYERRSFRAELHLLRPSRQSANHLLASTVSDGALSAQDLTVHRQPHAGGATTSALTERYGRRQPETTALYRAVREHLDPFLDEARERDGEGYPQFIEREFRRYLRLRSTGARLRAAALLGVWLRATGRLLVQG